MVKYGLTNNQLKIIAMVTMTIDHIGAELFPQLLWLRIIGRIAFPIYAYMIAEGCRHTRSMERDLLSIALMAAACQIACFFHTGSLYMCILVTFSLSIGLIFLIDNAIHKQTFGTVVLMLFGFATAFFLCEILPYLLPGTDYCVDYGFLGVLIPVCIYLARDPRSRLLVLMAGLSCLAYISVNIQWMALAAVPLLALYNGQRGKWKLKWFFYLFYPAHLFIIHIISLLL